MTSNGASSDATVTKLESKIPVLLLKTKSIPNDGYSEYFSSREQGCDPTFVPVLEHRFEDAGMEIVRELVREKAIGKDKKYGGLIFTSQRAVEAFAKIVAEGPVGEDNSEEQQTWPHLQSIPVYTVGPATSRALRSIPQTPALQIFGEETGNGEALAGYILEHYKAFYSDSATAAPAAPLLFLVGETRRDIIPKTLLAATEPIRVDELIVYGTGVMASFEDDFSRVLAGTDSVATRWVVVFSPTGCEAMLRALGMLDPESGRVRTGERGGGCGVRKGRRRTYVATIGPTTRDYLRRNFGFEPDVCAAKPSPEGVGNGIAKFMADVEKLEKGNP